MTQIKNMLDRAANFLQDKFEKHGVVEIEYERAGVGVITVSAIVGRTVYSQDNQTGLIDRIIQNDYTVRQSALTFDEGVTTTRPKRNDIIRQTLANGTVYEGRVLGEGGVPHYEESDGYGVAFRIHSKRDEITT